MTQPLGSLAILLVTLSSLVGCAGKPKPARIGAGRVSHVVVCWLKDPGDAAAQSQLVRASESFRAIPGVEEVVVGWAIPSDRPVVDDSFDLLVAMLFTDQRALRAYESDPLHQQAVRDVLRPHVERFVVYDAQERLLKYDPDKK